MRQFDSDINFEKYIYIVKRTFFNIVLESQL